MTLWNVVLQVLQAVACMEAWATKAATEVAAMEEVATAVKAKAWMR